MMQELFAAHFPPGPMPAGSGSQLNNGIWDDWIFIVLDIVVIQPVSKPISATGTLPRMKNVYKVDQLSKLIT